MLQGSDELIFAEDEMRFDEELYPQEEKGAWKLLVVDDELEVHNVTKMVLSRFQFEGRKLKILSAFSGAEARKLLMENNDIAVILLDVVMEEDDTGLKMIRFIREELVNTMVRIIIRTGQPGQAPEERVIIDYDINDYKEKTELTSQKLYTTIVASLRAYRDLITIDTGRKGLQSIVDTFSDIFFEQPQKDFAKTVLARLEYIIKLCDPECRDSSSFAALKREDTFYILASTGKYLNSNEKDIRDVADGRIINDLYKAYEARRNIYKDNSIVMYIKGMQDTESLILFEGCSRLSDSARYLIEVFTSNVTAVNEAIVSSNKYEAERRQHLLSEKLRELIRNMAATLDLEGVFEKLLESLGSVVAYKRGLAVLIEDEYFKVAVLKEEEEFKTADCLLGEIECDIVNEVVERGLPYSCSGLDILPTTQDMCFHSCLAVPVNLKEKLFAVILMQDIGFNEYSGKDEDIACTFADQAGMAIENALLFEEVYDRNADIKNILDNAGQGFLTFGEDLRIHGEYSEECRNIFGRRIEGAKFSDLIYEDKEQRNYVETMFQKVLNMETQKAEEIYLPLLPGEVQLNGRYIEISYRMIEDSVKDEKLFMVILTDCSDKKLLENKMENEHNILKMVVKAVTDYEDMIKCTKDYEDFCRYKIHEILDGDESPDIVIYEIMRQVHTFKGSFSQLDFMNIVVKLHEFETELSDLRGNRDTNVPDSLRNGIKTREMLLWLEKDLQILRDTLGDGYLKNEKAIFVDQAKLIEIEKQIQESGGNVDGNMILAKLKRLRYRPFKELLKQYPAYVEKLASQLDKHVKPLVIAGGDFPVDYERYQNFARSLVHVFRNAVDHGIESSEERISSGKSDDAAIECEVSLADNVINISISDDGAGICADRIRNTAVDGGFIDRETASGLDECQVLRLIFEEFFTTRSIGGEYSGRGIGLSAVKKEIDRLGGSIEVKTEAGKGTSFIFKITYEDHPCTGLVPSL